MLTSIELLFYCLAALAIMLTPGPNMIYCVSRALCQGRVAGWVSVLGVQAGIAAFLNRSAFWMRTQRFFMATALTGLAVRLVLTEKK